MGHGLQVLADNLRTRLTLSAAVILSFQNRITLFFAALFIGIQALTIISVYRVSRDNLIHQLDQNLLYAEQIFQRLLMERGERIAGETRILVADFGFRSTVSSGDAKTISSALENLALRIRAQRAFYIDLRGQTVADTANRLQGGHFIFPDALTMAENNGKAVVFGMLAGKLYEWAIVPVLAPLPIGWVAIAQTVDQHRVNQFKQLSSLPLDISIAEFAGGNPIIRTSSLPAQARTLLTEQLSRFGERIPGTSQSIDLAGSIYISRLHRLPSAAGDQALVAILQIDFAQAMARYWPMFYAAAGLSLLGLLIALAGSALIAKSLSSPLKALAGAGERMLDGGLNTSLPVTRQDELGRLAETFNRAARLAAELSQLQQKDQLRREMVATVSHDLRTPLTSLYGFLETMQHKAGSLPEQEQRQFLATALRQTEKVSRLAQELFELAKLECDETSLSPENFCLTELLQDIAQKFQLDARQRRIALSAELRRDLPPIQADIGLIERLLTNLIDNALRHTPAGGQVRIDASPDNGVVAVTVSDTGAGIAAQYLSTLFDWESPLSRKARQEGGGFGLVVVGKIVRLHGGDIQVESQPGQGTRFRFTLPTVPVDR